MKITLCGSARFEDKFKKWNKILTLQGHVVYSLACYPSDNKKKNWYTDSQKEMLDKIHKDKITNSDAIVVLNGEERYIGDSTKSEISHAFNLKKRVFWEFWPNDETIYEWYEHGYVVHNAGSLFEELCRYQFCENFLGKPPCGVTCYE